MNTSEAAAALSRARWARPDIVAARRESRYRRIARLVAAFPVTADEAEAIRALLPPAADGGRG